MTSDKADEVLKKLFDSLKNLESMKSSEFVFNFIHLLYYKYHKNLQIVMAHISILQIG